VAECEAAGGIDHNRSAVEGVADSRPRRSQSGPAGVLHAETAIGRWRGVALARDGAIQIALDAENEIGRLPVETGLTATQEAGRGEIELRAGRERREVVIRLVPMVHHAGNKTGIGADIG